VESRSRSGWRFALRTVVFGVLAAVVLLVLAVGRLSTLEESHQPRRAELYRRGGDTFTGLYYLARGAGWKKEKARRFLYPALAYYLLARQADPSEVKIQVSLALVLDALGRDREARGVISGPLKGDLPWPLRRQLTAVFAIIVSTRTRQSVVDAAYKFLSGVRPGRMTLARAYESMGEMDLAQREWSKAEAEAQPLLRAVVVMLAICGAMVLAGVLGAVWVLTRRLRRQRAEAVTREALPQARWGMREALEALILWIFLQAACGILLVVAMPAEKELGIILVVVSSVLSGGAALVWVWLASGRRAGLGWRWGHAWRQVGIGISAAGLSALPVLGVYQIFQQLLGQGLADEPIVPLVLAGPAWQDKAVVIVALCVVVPALEETIFRGVLYGALRRQWSFGPAAVVSAAVFAVAHMQFAGLVGYLAVGLLFAYLYERCGSLVAPWAAHAAFNGFNLAILLTLFGQG